MALKLRRGTEANRTSITPSEGELIYITDTKKLYSGDGTTAGGILVTGGGGASIPGIDDNTTAGAVLTLGDLVIAIDADLSITGYEINGDGDIDITGNITASGAGTGIITASSFVGDVTGNVTGDVTGNASGAHTGTFDGDMTGSVFGDDSTILVDGNNNTLHGNIITSVITAATGNLVDINPTLPSAVNSLTVNADEANSQVKLSRTSTGVLGGTGSLLGSINWERDGSDGQASTILQLGYPNSWLLGVDDSGTFSVDKFIAFTDGKFGIGITTPTESLDVVGNAIISGSLTAGAVLLSGSNIDTSDSSAITITPAVVISSNLFVENDLTVSNIVYAESFVSNSTGTPEITSAANLDLSAGNAVRITSSVLRLASFTTTERNALAGQNGDIIYNTTDNKFQGYENGAWANLI